MGWMGTPKGPRSAAEMAVEYRETSHEYLMLENWPRAAAEAAYSTASAMIVLMTQQEEMLEIMRSRERTKWIGD